MNFLYRFFNRFLRFFYKKYTLSQVSFSSKEAKRTIILGKNVRFYNHNVRLGKNVTIFDGAIFWGDGEIAIDDDAKIGFNTIIYSSKEGGVFIGKNTAIAANCYIIDKNHTTKTLNPNVDNPLAAADVYKRIFIGDNVWIAANCVVAVGSKLNNGCVIGANSFVNKVIPENAIAVGSPAVVRKYRGDKQ